MRDVKSRMESLEAERLKLENQLDEIHSELSNSHALNSVLEAKFDEVNSTHEVHFDTMSDTHRQLQQQLKCALEGTVLHL